MTAMMTVVMVKDVYRRPASSQLLAERSRSVHQYSGACSGGGGAAAAAVVVGRARVDTCRLETTHLKRSSQQPGRATSAGSGPVSSCSLSSAGSSCKLGAPVACARRVGLVALSAPSSSAAECVPVARATVVPSAAERNSGPQSRCEREIAARANERQQVAARRLARSSLRLGQARALAAAAALVLLLAAPCQLGYGEQQERLEAITSAPLDQLGSSLEGPNDDSGPLDGINLRNEREARLSDKLKINSSQIFEVLFKKKAYSRYWSVEQKWDDLFKRVMSLQGTIKQIMVKKVLRDSEYYADMSLSKQCEQDLKFVQEYARHSTNFRWLLHMLDAAGKPEPGMLTGNLAHLGHVMQCIKVRAPARASNHSFDERRFEQQTRLLGERFRGKYCLASLRPVLPSKPRLVSRFDELFDTSRLSNVSYMGEPAELLRRRSSQFEAPDSSLHASLDRARLDQVPFESELYAYLVSQRNFMFSLPRYMGSCYPSSCSSEDIRAVLQKGLDEQHQVAELEFECELEQDSLWEWLSTPRLVCYVLLGLLGLLVGLASLVRHILVDRLRLRRNKLAADSRLGALLEALELVSMDKCAGVLFIKTHPATTQVNWARPENRRSSSIDALRGLLMLLLVYAQLVYLGALPVPFMWAKWADAMFPFYRAPLTQLFLSAPLWTEAFYLLAAYLAGVKFLENARPSACHAPKLDQLGRARSFELRVPNFFSFALKRYLRLLSPMLAFILLNYVWPQLSNGFVMQDQANKLMRPCDSLGWTNLLMFHNHQSLSDTCLWPSHVSATFFQLHLLSYPLLVLCLMCLHGEFEHTTALRTDTQNCNNINSVTSSGRRKRRLILSCMKVATCALLASLFLAGALVPALKARAQQLIVPFLIDYLDFDNYERVIEWMLMPTYNHLSAYVAGLLLAWLVAQRRMRREIAAQLRLAAGASAHSFHSHCANQWVYGGAPVANASAPSEGSFVARKASSDSLRSSSTEGIVANFQRQATPVPQQQKYELEQGAQKSGAPSTRSVSPECATCCASPRPAYLGECDEELDEAGERRARESGLAGALKSALAALIMLATLISSWWWNGLGEPMSELQTVCYVALAKICFCASFGYLFLRHLAERRNCHEPWMLTRFLVPIGRMSLSLFYLSWLVIWFDLLSSPYQWHPSHYFVFEKFTEIICISLILAMLVYGAFEGMLRRVQLAARAARFERRLERGLELAPFERMFEPADMATAETEPSATAAAAAARAQQETLQQRQVAEACHGLEVIVGREQRLALGARTKLQGALGPPAASSVAAQRQRGDKPTRTAAELSAELRANHSFASIGLYESAGVGADLARSPSGCSPSSSDLRAALPSGGQKRPIN